MLVVSSALDRLTRAMCFSFGLLLGCNSSAPNVAPWTVGHDAGLRTSSDASVGDTHDATTYEDPDACLTPELTASDFGATFMRERCAWCHSAALMGAARNGAPDLVNFDSTGEIAARATDVRLRVIVQRTMPPGAPVSDCVALALSRYLDSFGACTPSCDGRNCGADGCGGSCGTCGAGSSCDGSSGQCFVPACDPICEGVACGDDGCGGACGQCAIGLTCTDKRTCACVPNCDQRACGADGCGGSCGNCTQGEVCGLEGSCVCLPECDGKLCGNDGCGGTCGSCTPGLTCDVAAAACTCIPNCQNRLCGDDGCGGSCGSCSNALTCNTRTGACVRNCRADCTGRVCGDDGCGSTCGGGCMGADQCDTSGRCVCVPNCVGRACGNDGCGGSCGSCGIGTACDATGHCGCTSNCNGRACGDDGCGGTCGSCAAPAICASGQCLEQCAPSCDGRSCGDDGCGGTCGSCASGQYCTQGKCSYPGKSFGADIYPLFTAASCGKSACHAGAQPAAALDLSNAAVSYSELVNVGASQCSSRLLVAPDAPTASYLVSKLTATDMCSGSRMPKGGSPLSIADIDTIRSWIGSGALP
jgi:hypothetical protein